jgi:hypothetical protein
MGLAAQGVDIVLERVSKTRPVTLYGACAYEFTREALTAAGPQAMQFGCSPDFDAYNMGARHTRVDPAALGTERGAWRFAGGHIHVGYKDVCDIPEYAAALFCDVTLGLALVVAGEQQGRRRDLYGMAGRFRPTPYGVEYRTPSNQWLYMNDLRDYASSASGVLSSVFHADSATQLRLFNEVPWKDVATIINTENRAEARQMLSWLSDSYRNLGFRNLI